MKFLLVFAVVLVAVWIWRNNRQHDLDHGAGSAPRRRAPRTTTMVVCDQCGMHLPEEEAVRGRSGTYCGHEHRRLSEDTAH